MHHHLEIVMPPTNDIEAAVKLIMAPFDENTDADADEGSDRHAFWDFYVIGGRWAGHKLLAHYDKAQLDKFYEWLNDTGITVSGVQCGKQELSPASQIPIVDAKWNEMFPSSSPVPCPLFAHSNDQYGHNGLDDTLPGDVMLLGSVPKGLTCSRVIVAGPSFNSATNTWDGPIRPVFMLCDSQWNGVNHMDIKWDGTLASAIDECRGKLSGYRPEFAAKVSPQDNWLAVTVDYHS
jgi:hypothetical protein